MENYEDLVKEFDGEFVAICEQKVVDHDEELSDLMERIREKYPEENVFVDFVSSEKLTPISHPGNRLFLGVDNVLCKNQKDF